MSNKETCPDCGREMHGGEDVLVGGELDREKKPHKSCFKCACKWVEDLRIEQAKQLKNKKIKCIFCHTFNINIHTHPEYIMSEGIYLHGIFVCQGCLYTMEGLIEIRKKQLIKEHPEYRDD